jgi:hypothetical protein
MKQDKQVAKLAEEKSSELSGLNRNICYNNVRNNSKKYSYRMEKGK